MARALADRGLRPRDHPAAGGPGHRRDGPARHRAGRVRGPVDGRLGGDAARAAPSREGARAGAHHHHGLFARRRRHPRLCGARLGEQPAELARGAAQSELRRGAYAHGAHPRQSGAADRRGHPRAPGALPAAGARRRAAALHRRILRWRHHPPPHRHRRHGPAHHPADAGVLGRPQPPALGEHLARQVQHGTFHCAADTGHWAQYESADEHNRVVADFLRRRGNTSNNTRQEETTWPRPGI